MVLSSTTECFLLSVCIASHHFKNEDTIISDCFCYFCAFLNKGVQTSLYF